MQFVNNRLIAHKRTAFRDCRSPSASVTSSGSGCVIAAAASTTAR